MDAAIGIIISIIPFLIGLAAVLLVPDREKIRGRVDVQGSGKRAFVYLVGAMLILGGIALLSLVIAGILQYGTFYLLNAAFYTIIGAGVIAQNAVMQRRAKKARLAVLRYQASKRGYQQ